MNNYTDIAVSTIIDLSYDVPKPISAIYFLIKNDEIVYIGQSKDFNSRYSFHLKKKRIDFDKCFHFQCPKEHLKETERQLILKHRPKYNRELFLKKIRKEHLNYIGENI